MFNLNIFQYFWSDLIFSYIILSFFNFKACLTACVHVGSLPPQQAQITFWHGLLLVVSAMEASNIVLLDLGYTIIEDVVAKELLTVDHIPNVFFKTLTFDNK